MNENNTEVLEGEVIQPGASPALETTDVAGQELGRYDRVGRPTDMTPDVVTKLIAAFNNAYNITEACDYAGISRTTYYRWLEADDQFSYKMSQAQSAVNRRAKEVVVDAIKSGDAQIAFRYLTARDPDFKPTLAVGTDQTVEEARNNLRGVLDAIGKHDPSSEPPTADVGNDTRLVEGDSTDIS